MNKKSKRVVSDNRADVAAARKALKEKGAVPLVKIKKRLGMEK